jgi:hypothetical protein
VANGQRVGYIRVSSVGQKPERQLEGVKVDTLFTDTVSDASKPELSYRLCWRSFARAIPSSFTRWTAWPVTLTTCVAWCASCPTAG